MFKRLFNRLKTRFKSFGPGWIYDLRSYSTGSGWSETSFRYEFTWAEFYIMAIETYKSNSDFQEAIDKLATACSNLPIKLCKIKDDSEVEQPEELKIFLRQPLQNLDSWPDFILLSLISYYVGGEIIYFKKEETKKLVPVFPHELSKVDNLDGRPYRFHVSQAFFNRTKLLGFDQYKTNVVFDSEIKVNKGIESDLNKIAMMRTENLSIDNRGLSIVAGMLNHIGVLKQGPKWNHNLLRNEGRPSGIFYYPSPDKTALMASRSSSDAAGAKVEDEIKSNFAGSENAGKALFLKNGLAFKEVMMKSKDMDFIAGLRFSREMIANRLGIPLPLFGSEAKSSYNNLKEMKEVFFLNTISPLMNKFLYYLSQKVIPDFFPYLNDTYLCVDIDKTEYASMKKSELEQNLEKVTFMTENEKRERIGLEKLNIDNMDIPIKKGGTPIDQLGLGLVKDEDEDLEDEDLEDED